jgi:hypothetical protein
MLPTWPSPLGIDRTLARLFFLLAFLTTTRGVSLKGDGFIDPEAADDILDSLGPHAPLSSTAAALTNNKARLQMVSHNSVGSSSSTVGAPSSRSHSPHANSVGLLVPHTEERLALEPMPASLATFLWEALNPSAAEVTSSATPGGPASNPMVSHLHNGGADSAPVDLHLLPSQD